MCADQNIPHMNHFQNIREVLNNTNELVDDPTDISDIHNPRANSDDDIIDAQNTEVNSINPRTIHSTLVNMWRIRIPYELSEDYENLFREPMFKRRRNERSALYERGLQVPGCYRRVVFDWARYWFEDSYAAAEEHFLSVEHKFDQMLEDADLPERLDFNSWSAREVLRVFTANISAGSVDELQPWGPHMGDGQTVKFEELDDGRLKESIPFVGEASPGRLIWLLPGGFRPPRTEYSRQIFDAYKAELLRCEQALVCLARRIANLVAFDIIELYAIPGAQQQGRPLLSRSQIDSAVKEILGEAWFDLPFDVDGRLRNWTVSDAIKDDEDLPEMFPTPERGHWIKEDVDIWWSWRDRRVEEVNAAGDYDDDDEDAVAALDVDDTNSDGGSVWSDVDELDEDAMEVDP